ncbi:PAS domain S-box protein [Leptolyngbya sp. NK1-12]|uniref:Circadian input-output histidine kinase CikA n=1 Tax=Leptolyngbya sp. NK1-12 TaxID=2547451 RepID=A0AA96WUW2_9CYAN|nr:PAS domain S-box protein [Leptolyngbya sp. NK1-12]WNZ23787.1 PAS domain S-box protein [Leptolyngbya sp. NK1-12]
MNTPTILCVDDEQDVLLTLRTQLMQDFPDYMVETAERGDEALTLVDALMAKGVEIPLVIVAQNMPGMQGDELLMALHARHPEMLKVMLTEQIRIKDVVNVVYQGSLYRFITKPWDETDLSLTVAEALRRYQQDQQIARQQAALEQANRELEALNTEQKRLEMTLRDSEEQNRAILSAVPDIMTIINAEGQYLSFSRNQFMGELIASENSDLTGLHVNDILPPELAIQYLTAIRQALNTGEIQTFEQQIQFGDRIQYEEARIVPYQSDRVLCLVRNISERKQIELEISRSRDLREAIFNESTDALFLVDPDTLLTVDCNKRAIEMFEADRKESLINIEGHTLQCHPFTVEELQQISDEVHTQGFWSREIEYITLKGNSFWGNLAANRISVADRHLNLVRVTDISNRKRAELALAEVESQQRSILENVPSFITKVGRDGRMLFVNRLAAGFSLDDVIGHTVDEFTAPESRAIQRDTLAEVFATGRTLTIETLGTGDNGKPATYEVRIAPIQTEGQIDAAILVATDISERRQTELALQQSEARFRQLADTVSEGFFVFEVASFQYSYVNPAYEAIVGIPFQEINSVSSWLDSVHPDDREQVEAGLQRELQGEVFDKEYRFIRPDGELRWLRCRAFPIVDQTGAVIRIVGTVDDISDRKQAEIALQQLNEELEQRVQQRTQELARSEQDLRTIFNNVYDAIFIHDLNGTILDVNDRALELHGAARDQLLAATIADLSAPDTPRERISEMRQQVQTGKRIQFEWKARRFGDHSSFDAEISLKKTTLGNQPVCIVGVRDISDRKQAEAQLREQEQFLRSIYEGVNQPIFVGTVLPDQSVRQLGWNPSAARLMGKSSEEVAGRPLEEIFAAEDAAEVIQRYAQSITTKQPFTVEERITFQGQPRWVLSTYNPLINEAGQVHRVVSTLYDITDRKQLEQELLQINAELERRVEERTLDLEQAMRAAEAASRAKSTFLANMSHELRTPLNAILGFSQLLSRDTTLPPEQQQRVNIINRSGEHLLNLINDILEMSKIEAGRVNLTLKNFDLFDLLKSLEELFRLKAESKGLRLVIQSDADVPQYIQADEGKLRQVLINLLSNAIKFTQAGSVTLRVQAESAKNEKLVAQSERAQARAQARAQDPALIGSQFFIRFEVADTGPGIDLPDREVVFEPFVQTEIGQNSQEGTGLGLPISRQFVQLMGGDLTVESLPGQGATFRFTIPVALVQAVDLSAERPIRRMIGLAPNQPVYRLLVVEDNPENRQFLVQLLQSVGFEVQAASNGQDAVTLWQQWAPHLIWMDMRMPVMDGYEATRRIRSLVSPFHSPPKILALTASAFGDESAAILAAGCDDLVCKPATEASLFRKIAEHLGVCYVYAEQPDGLEPEALALETTSPENAAQLNQQLVDVLPLMPSEWIEQLQQAARRADEELILQLLEQLPPTQTSLADALRALVNEFQLEQLIELTGNVTKAL